MSIEAMKLALEALENVTKDYVESRQYKHNKAITALRLRLAQPEQKPVAWAVFEGWNAHDLYLPQEYDEALKMVGYKGGHAEVKPLYTAPPAQEFVCSTGLCHYKAKRPWVGLTDEEVYPLANEHLHYQMEGYEVSGIYNLARAIEAKLKEKNT